MTQSISPLLSSYLSDTSQKHRKSKILTLIVDFKPLKEMYFDDRFSHIHRLVDFYDFVSVLLSLNDTAQIWTLLDQELDPLLEIEVLSRYDLEINDFSALVFAYMHEVQSNVPITNYQILQIFDDIAQVLAFVGD